MRILSPACNSLRVDPMEKDGAQGDERQIYLGPKAQEIVKPFLLRPENQFSFSPREAVDEHRTKMSEERKTPLSCGNSPGINRRRRPKPRERYDTSSYWRAIARACEKAGVPRWHPHQLRHNSCLLYTSPSPRDPE